MQDERLAHLDRALASGAEGSAFESRISHKKSCLISDSFFLFQDFAQILKRIESRLFTTANLDSTYTNYKAKKYFSNNKKTTSFYFLT